MESRCFICGFLSRSYQTNHAKFHALIKNCIFISAIGGLDIVGRAEQVTKLYAINQQSFVLPLITLRHCDSITETTNLEGTKYPS